MQKELTDYNYKIGQKVIDTENINKSHMRVTDNNVGKANQIRLSDGSTIAQNNPNYSEEDTVIEVVYESTIQSFLNNNNPSNQKFKDELTSFEKQWNVSFKRYYFPESRLNSK